MIEHFPNEHAAKNGYLFYRPIHGNIANFKKDAIVSKPST